MIIETPTAERVAGPVFLVIGGGQAQDDDAPHGPWYADYDETE